MPPHADDLCALSPGPNIGALNFDIVPDGGPGASVRGGDALKDVKLPEGVKLGVI